MSGEMWVFVCISYKALSVEKHCKHWKWILERLPTDFNELAEMKVVCTGENVGPPCHLWNVFQCRFCFSLKKHLTAFSDYVHFCYANCLLYPPYTLFYS